MSKVPLNSPVFKEKVISQRNMNKERAPKMRSILDSNRITNTRSSDCTRQLSVPLQILSGVCELERDDKRRTWPGQALAAKKEKRLGNLAKVSPCPALTTVIRIKGKIIFYTSKISVAQQSRANSSRTCFSST